MSKFRIQPHGRLQEWVAEEKGYFTAEGLDYEFVTSYATGVTWSASVQSTDSAPPDIKRGAYEDYEEGRACEISSACHWAVNMSSSAQQGKMWGHAYSVAPSGIYVAPESPVRQPTDLANVDVGVGYHSGSHFSALQALEGILAAEEIRFRFIGLPNDRLAALLDRKIAAANVFGAPSYVVEQQGFRKIVDTTFMIGFLFGEGADVTDVERYFRALQRAQRDIDLQPELYKHYFLRELPAQHHSMVDMRGFGTGERLVFEPYTREAFEQTHRWMESRKGLLETEVTGADYAAAVLV